MRAIQLYIEGNWAHFKKPETNNNPLTHDFITKTALIGLIGAVLGKGRDEMRPLFPELSENLLYGVRVVNPIKKESWGFTMRKAVNLMDKAPKYLEILKKPSFLVSVALANSESEEHFVDFCGSIKKNESRFTPVLGLHNCPANLAYNSEGSFSGKENGSFTAKCFVSRKHILDIRSSKHFRVGLDRIPTFQNNDFWNLPEKYVEVIYPSENNEIVVKGDFYRYSDGEPWWLT